ncbi:MAG: O-antigen ligase family protein [Bacilli bacterium]|nr:O-antigen ligase family protein [Bacilli bacterium]
MKHKKTLYYLFIFFPILDLITALLTRNFTLTITPGIVVKGFLMFISIIYIFFTKSKYKRISLIYLSFFLLYSLFYFLVKPELINIKFFINEINYVFKILYFPIIYFGLLCFYDDNNFHKKEIVKILKINLITMSFLLLLPIILNSAHETYSNELLGYIGWFYAGNEISNIMVILLPIIYYFISKEQKYQFLIVFPIILSILFIGTKVSLIGTIIVVILNLFYSILKEKKLKTYNVVISVFILLTTIIFSINSFGVYNYKYNLTNIPSVEKDKQIIIDDQNKQEVYGILSQTDNFYLMSNFNNIFKSLLSSRDLYLANTLSIYNDDQTNRDIFFGIGFSNTEAINNNNITKLIEIDILDIFFHYGIFGLLISFSPFILASYLIFDKRKKPTLRSYYYFSIFLLVFCISTLSGHVYTAPAVAIYLVFYLLLMLDEFKIFSNQKELKNKISIISLHLGYGGIERSVINQANMLCEKYEIEIICLYKVVNKIPYHVDNRVNVIYLSDLKPNKQEFLKHLKQKNIFKIISEGIKSVNILYKKHSLIKNYIYNSDSKIIISTRLEFTKLLNKYGNNKAIKIAEEHVYHNESKKYFIELKKSLKNIDYLLPTSKYLTKDYKLIFKNEKVKVIYIPNIIYDIPKSLNKLNNNNIISVGRLSPEKGFIDLIDVFRIINKKNKKIKLTLAGDGPEKNLLEQKIKAYKLDKSIKLTGFLTQDDLKKEYCKASLFVMSSYEESFGLVLIEAMSYGIPCFAFDSALGAKEIINNKNGILIKNRDKEKMAEEILKYFNNDNPKLSDKAKKTSDDYTFDKVKIKWYDFIDQIINK